MILTLSSLCGNKNRRRGSHCGGPWHETWLHREISKAFRLGTDLILIGRARNAGLKLFFKQRDPKFARVLRTQAHHARRSSLNPSPTVAPMQTTAPRCSDDELAADRARFPRRFTRGAGPSQADRMSRELGLPRRLSARVLGNGSARSRLGPTGLEGSARLYADSARPPRFLDRRSSSRPRSGSPACAEDC